MEFTNFIIGILISKLICVFECCQLWSWCRTFVNAKFTFWDLQLMELRAMKLQLYVLLLYFSPIFLFFARYFDVVLCHYCMYGACRPCSFNTISTELLCMYLSCSYRTLKELQKWNYFCVLLHSYCIFQHWSIPSLSTTRKYY